MRREDWRLITGRGRYVTDIMPDDCLHVAFVRSVHARGKLRELDTDEAAAAPGVVSIVTGADVQGLGALPVNPLTPTVNPAPFPVLAHRRVFAVGQPVAAVIATSAAAAVDAAEMVFEEFAAAPAVLDGGGAKPLFKTVPDNLGAAAAWRSGNADRAFEEAAATVSARLRHPRLAPAALEPRAAVAEMEGGRLMVWLPSQSPQRARQDLAAILGIGAEKIRVIAPDVGGAFGMKASLYPEDVLVAWAALELDRPVRWVATRAEEFLAATHGRGIASEGELALDASGRALALRARISAPLGHWMPFSAVVPARNAGRILPGPYRVPAVDIGAAAHVSTTAPVGIYRGAGRPEAALLMERLMDLAAAALDIDRVELRRSNLIADDAFPYVTPTGETLDPGRYGALLDRALETAGRSISEAASEVTGVGLGFYVEPSGQGWETARVEWLAADRVRAVTGSCAQGQGRETAAAALVAEVLGLAPEDVDVVLGDTDAMPNATGALASRSTPIGGSALLKAAEDVKAARAAGADFPVVADVTWEAPGEAWGYGCAIAVVSIDPDTGTVTVDRLTWVDDCGRVMNEQLVEGQLLGGIAQGLGEALMERIVYDDDGQLLTGSFMDYALPRAADMPPVTFDRLETPTPHNLLGARGVGEAGTIGAPAAVLNAVMDALRPFGVRHLDMPLTPEKIWRAMKGLPPLDDQGTG